MRPGPASGPARTGQRCVGDEKLLAVDFDGFDVSWVLLDLLHEVGEARLFVLTQTSRRNELIGGHGGQAHHEPD